jgi:hypothetical protein
MKPKTRLRLLQAVMHVVGGGRIGPTCYYCTNVFQNGMRPCHRKEQRDQCKYYQLALEGKSGNEYIRPPKA